LATLSRPPKIFGHLSRVNIVLKSTGNDRTRGTRVISKKKNSLIQMYQRQHKTRISLLTNLLLTKGHSINQLSKQLGVTKRSIYRYLQYLEENGTPIEVDFNNNYFIVQ